MNNLKKRSPFFKFQNNHHHHQSSSSEGEGTRKLPKPDTSSLPHDDTKLQTKMDPTTYSLIHACPLFRSTDLRASWNKEGWFRFHFRNSIQASPPEQSRQCYYESDTTYNIGARIPTTKSESRECMVPVLGFWEQNLRWGWARRKIDHRKACL